MREWVRFADTMIELKKDIKWRYVLLTIISFSVVLGFITHRYIHKQKVFSANIHRSVVIVDKDCTTSKQRSRLYFYYLNGKQHIIVSNTFCESVNVFDTIDAIYDADYNIFYNDTKLNDELYGGIGFIVLGFVILFSLFFKLT